MEGPFFNTRATKIAVVVKGEGYMEMACPHVSQQQQGQGQSTGEQRREQQQQSASPHYQRLSSPLKRGMLFVVPAGHPLIVVAGNNRNLEIVCFDVNAENNRRESLAGTESNELNTHHFHSSSCSFHNLLSSFSLTNFRGQEHSECTGERGEGAGFQHPSKRGGRGVRKTE